MKVLISAFAFSPLWGSEPAVGWNWAVQIAREHDVTVLTHAYFRAHVDPVLAAPNAPQLQMEYLALEPRRGVFDEQLLNSQFYYLRWQRASRKRILELLSRESFDLVHHLTWGSFRLAAPLHGLPVPLVLGPLGGGERAPFALYRELPWKSKLKELARDALIFTGAIDPWVRRGWGDARLVMCRTPQTTAALPQRLRARSIVVHDIGTDDASASSAAVAAADVAVPQAGRLRCLFVGRLIAWKGPHLALRAIALLRERGVEATLTIVGGGELEPFLRGLAQRLGIADAIDWVSHVPREQVLGLYASHDLFLFPSLHDSGGTVVLEALSRGCPVVCVDLGGPPHFVTAECGRVVQASDGAVDAVPGRLADELQRLAADPALRLQLRAGAVRQAAAHSWTRRVGDAYAQVRAALEAPRR